MPDGLSSSRLEDLQMRWQQDPDSRVYLQLAEEYRKLDRHPEAIDVLKRGLRSRPNDLSGQVALGRCHLEMEEYEAAAQALEIVVGRDPTHIVGNKLLLEVYLDSGDARKAGERLDLYKLLNPADPDLGGLDGRLHRLRQGAAPAPAPPRSAAAPAESPAVTTSGGGVAPRPPSSTVAESAAEAAAAGADPFETWPGKTGTPTGQPAEAPRREVPALETPAREAPPPSPGPEAAFPAIQAEPSPPPRARPAPQPADDIFDLGPPPPPPSLDELFDLGPPQPTPSLDDLWGPTAAPEPPAVEAAEVMTMPETLEELSATEPAEEVSATEPLEEMSSIEPLEEVTEPVEEVTEVVEELSVSAEPEPFERASATEPLEEAPAAEPVEESAVPEPVEEVAAAESIDELLEVAGAAEEKVGEAEERIEVAEHEPATATLGEIYLKQGYVEEAEKIFRQVLQQNPKSAAAMAGLARIRGETGLTAHALLARVGHEAPPGLTAKKIRILESYVQFLRQAAGRIHVS